MSTRFGEQLVADQMTILFLRYSRAITRISSNKARLAEAASAQHRDLYRWTKNGVERRQKDEVSGPPFLREVSFCRVPVVSYDQGIKRKSGLDI